MFHLVFIRALSYLEIVYVRGLHFVDVACSDTRIENEKKGSCCKYICILANFIRGLFPYIVE